MINKKKLESFIEKYYLGGLIESAVIGVSNKTLKTKFITDNKDMIAEVTMGEFDIEDCEIGVYYTGVLSKMLSILQDDIDIDLTMDDNDKVSTLKISDNKGREVKYATSDTDIIDSNSFVQKTVIKDFDVEISLTNELKNDILKSAGIKLNVNDSNDITFKVIKGKYYIIVGYSDNNTNQIKMEVPTVSFDDDIDEFTFSAEHVTSVLNANKNYNSAKMEISSKGILKMSFEYDDGSSYYLSVKKQ